MQKPRRDPCDVNFEALSRHAPARAGDLAYKLFCTPGLSTRRSVDHDVLARRARYHLRHAEKVFVEVVSGGQVLTYVFHPDESDAIATVLVVHGWTSEASFMTAIAEPVRRSGYRVVLFDCPAHGGSSGRRTSLIDCARATVAVTKFFEKKFGLIHSVIAHSMGGLAALLAASGGRPLPDTTDYGHFILISSPNRFSEVTNDFAEEIGLTKAAQRVYERQLERIAHRSLGTFSASHMLKGLTARLLLIHAPDDQEVLIRNAYEVIAAYPTVELLEFDQLGHRNILYAPQVIRAIVGDLKREAELKGAQRPVGAPRIAAGS